MPYRQRRPRQRICKTPVVCLAVWLSIAIGMVLDRLELSPVQLLDTIGFGQQSEVVRDTPDTFHLQQQNWGQHQDNKDHGKGTPHPDQQSQENDVKKDIPDLKPQNHKNNREGGKQPWSSSVVPYDADTVTAKQLDSHSISMSGRLCGKNNCTYVHKGSLCNLWLTHDKRLLVMSWDTGILHVHSPAGVRRIQFTAHPFSLTQLPNELLAITCPAESSILLVDIGAVYGVVDVIEVKRKYFGIVLGFEPNTLIVSSPRDNDSLAVVDIINMQGEVLKTLADNKLVPGLDNPISLTRMGEHVLVCALSDKGTGEVSIMVRFGQSQHSQDNVHIYTDDYLWAPMGTSVDGEGNIFIAQFDGSVVMRTKKGRFRFLFDMHDEQFPYSSSLVVHKDRLVVAWRKPRGSSTLLVEYSLSSDDGHEP